jgi:hypothetical protein
MKDPPTVTRATNVHRGDAQLAIVIDITLQYILSLMEMPHEKALSLFSI